MTWSIIARDPATGRFGLAAASSRERWVHFRKYLPSRHDPVGITDRTAIEAGIAAARGAEAAS
jgi:hypothetical protein